MSVPPAPSAPPLGIPQTPVGSPDPPDDWLTTIIEELNSLVKNVPALAIRVWRLTRAITGLLASCAWALARQELSRAMSWLEDYVPLAGHIAKFLRWALRRNPPAPPPAEAPTPSGSLAETQCWFCLNARNGAIRSSAHVCSPLRPSPAKIAELAPARIIVEAVSVEARELGIRPVVAKRPNFHQLVLLAQRTTMSTPVLGAAVVTALQAANPYRVSVLGRRSPPTNFWGRVAHHPRSPLMLGGALGLGLTLLLSGPAPPSSLGVPPRHHVLSDALWSGSETLSGGARRVCSSLARSVEMNPDADSVLYAISCGLTRPRSSARSWWRSEDPQIRGLRVGITLSLLTTPAAWPIAALLWVLLKPNAQPPPSPPPPPARPPALDLTPSLSRCRECLDPGHVTASCPFEDAKEFPGETPMTGSLIRQPRNRPDPSARNRAAGAPKRKRCATCSTNAHASLTCPRALAARMERLL